MRVQLSPVPYAIAGLLALPCASLAAQTQPPGVAGSTGTTSITVPLGHAAQRKLPPLERTVSLDLQNVRLRTALDAIDRQAQLGLTYSPRVVPVDRVVSVRGKEITVARALAIVLRGTGVEAVTTSGGSVMLVKGEEKAERPPAVAGIVLGRVMDSETQRPLEGAIVSVKGTSIRFVTNEKGMYGLTKVPPGLQTIQARLLGYRAVEKVVMVRDSQPTRVDITMQMGMSRLQEQITTATGTRRRLEVANDVTTIDVDSVMATAPVTSLTDLLENRVPGLTIQHTSGAPGDPSRLRLRGVSSVYRSNDPIVIVDGIRVYYNQSDTTSDNIAGNFKQTQVAPTVSNYTPATPSPLDQIDPHSIETIEVLKGPSASTLYGPDAANGVIVITTKRGQSGPPRWAVSATHGLTEMPGEYPTGYFRWGHDYTGALRLCTLTEFECEADSLVLFQALNDPDFTVLDQGQRNEVSISVSGGGNELAYSLTGSYADEVGLLALPQFEAQRYRERNGSAPPEWMTRPHQLTSWSGTSRITAQLGKKAHASLTATLTRTNQQRSSLDQQLTALMGTYVDRATDSYYRVDGVTIKPKPYLVPDFYQRATDEATNFTNAANITWQPRTWLTVGADAGLNVINKNDQVFLPRGLLEAATDSLGQIRTGRGSSVVGTLNLRASARAPLFWGFSLQFATGVNYTDRSLSSLATGARDLIEGTSSVSSGREPLPSSETNRDETSFGWYLAPSISHDRFTITTGLRFDGSSSFGKDIKLPAFPKLGVSWLVSEEPFFPFRNIFDALRVRAAYGQAGVWPGESDRLRLYKRATLWNGAQFIDATAIEHLGNSKLEPERSTEIEGGFDADLLHSRLSISLTGYRKTRNDALLQVPLPPSIYGGGTTWRNIGVVRNTGLELSVGTRLLTTDLVSWSANVNLSRNRNTVVETVNDSTILLPNGGAAAPGYPLFSLWTRPILGYADANGNGIIESSEVQIGDTAVFMGDALPRYEAAIHSTLGFFRNAVTISGSLSYQDGLTQLNRTAEVNRHFSRGVNDPSAPFGEQAAVAVIGNGSEHTSNYGLIQTVSTWRINSISLAFNAPPSLARRLGTRSLSVALQGSNVALFSDYAGKDPNVNAYTSGNSVVDAGQLPTPRRWQISVRAGF